MHCCIFAHIIEWGPYLVCQDCLARDLVFSQKSWSSVTDYWRYIPEPETFGHKKNIFLFLKKKEEEAILAAYKSNAYSKA